MSRKREHLGVLWLIENVRKRPCLWNTWHPEYQCRGIKHNAWEDICRQLVVNFDLKSPLEKQEEVRSVMKKWKNLRDTFTRDLKLQKHKVEPMRKKQYLYFEDLYFLADVIRSRESYYSGDGIKVEPILLKTKTGETSSDQNEEDIYFQPTCDPYFVDYDPPTPVVTPTVNRRIVEEDPDLLFLLSLLSDLRRLPHSKKIKLKVKILEEVNRALEES